MLYSDIWGGGGQKYATIENSGFWFYIARPSGGKICCSGEVWNISLQSCQRKYNLKCVFLDVGEEPFHMHINIYFL